MELYSFIASLFCSYKQIGVAQMFIIHRQEEWVTPRNSVKLGGVSN